MSRDGIYNQVNSVIVKVTKPSPIPEPNPLGQLLNLSNNFVLSRSVTLILTEGRCCHLLAKWKKCTAGGPSCSLQQPSLKGQWPSATLQHAAQPPATQRSVSAFPLPQGGSKKRPEYGNHSALGWTTPVYCNLGSAPLLPIFEPNQPFILESNQPSWGREVHKQSFHMGNCSSWEVLLGVEKEDDSTGEGRVFRSLWPLCTVIF